MLLIPDREKITFRAEVQRLNMKPDEIAIRPNTCSGKWTDLIDWITEEKLTVTCDDDSTSSDLLGKKPINFVVQS